MEVLRWVSLALMWFAASLNIVVMIRGIRLNKRLQVEIDRWKEENNNETDAH